MWPVPKAVAASRSRRDLELAAIAALKAHVGPASYRFTDDQLLKLIDIVGSVGLACDALTMIPQPRFLESL